MVRGIILAVALLVVTGVPMLVGAAIGMAVDDEHVCRALAHGPDAMLPDKCKSDDSVPVPVLKPTE